MSFKSGNEKVYSGEIPKNTDIITPRKYEIVVLDKPCECGCGDWYIIGYTFSKSGNTQVFPKRTLLDCTQVSDELSEEILNEVLTTIPELV